MNILIFILCVYFILKIVKIIESLRRGKRNYDKIKDMSINITGKKGGEIILNKKNNRLQLRVVDKEGNTIIDTANE